MFLCFRDCFAGDIAVLANCKSLSVFWASATEITGKNFLAPFFRARFADDASANVPQVTLRS
jgi:hypothetical protein